MAKKPVKTIHLLHVAESLMAQNQIILNLVSMAKTADDFADRVDHAALKALVKKVAEEAEKVRAAFWPGDED